jgi:PAS domain S-box-containing protein
MSGELVDGIPLHLFYLFIRSLKDFALLTLNMQGTVTTWNVTAERLLGYTADEIIGQHFSRFYPPDDVRQGIPEQELAEARLHGQASNDRWLAKKDGSRFWASGVTTLLKDEESSGFAKFVRDLTASKESEGKIVRLNEQLEAKITAYDRAVQELQRINDQLTQSNRQLLDAQTTLREKVSELEQFEQAVVGRELKMIEMQKELQRLHLRLKE